MRRVPTAAQIPAADPDMRVHDETIVADDAMGARLALARLAPDVAVRESGAPLGLRQRVVGDDRLLLTSVEIASHLHVESGVSGGIGIARRRAGTLHAVTNGEEVDPGRPFLIRPGRAESWGTEVKVDLVILDLPSLGAFTGHDETTLHYETTGALSPELQRHWNLTIDHVERVFDDPDLLHNPLIRQAAVDAVFAATQHAFGIRSVADRPDDRAGSDAVARATTFIRDHLGEPISVGDIARAARLSVRGVQSAFSRVLGTTPAVYVRGARLAEVRADLLASDPTQTTVAEVARRWGFAHLPRFAQHYRAEYGEQPHATLRRSR